MKTKAGRHALEVHNKAINKLAREALGLAKRLNDLDPKDKGYAQRYRDVMDDYMVNRHESHALTKELGDVCSLEDILFEGRKRK
jgi:hypothetical protein